MSELLTTDVLLKIDTNLKNNAEAIFSKFGFNFDSAINMFLRHTVYDGNLPFNINDEIPNEETLAAMKEAELLINDPNTKKYNSFQEIIDEINKPIEFGNLSKEELDIEIEKGYKDMLDGNVEPAQKVFSDIHKEYGL